MRPLLPRTFNPTRLQQNSSLFLALQPLLEACARQLAEKLSDSTSSRPLLLSLGLRDHTPVSLPFCWFNSLAACT